MSVNSYLTDKSSSLVLSDLEKGNINTSIRTLESRLDSYFGSGIDNHFKFGSSTRGTILPRSADDNSDIDYMVVFNTDNGKNKPQTYLDRLKKFAEKKYSTSEIHQSSPTIVLSLNHIKFELVPAYYDYGYYIPSPSSSWSEWLYTDPNGSNQKIQDKNSTENYKIKPLVRLIKYWNASNGHHFASFDLENYIVNKFYYSCNSVRDYFYDFWGSFNCSYDTPQYIKDKVDRAKKAVQSAKENENYGYNYTAEQDIKKVIPE